ncbi:hypothetical protein CKF46_02280 [Klebsiella pneumoniae]|nr:hypothetical protein CKF46_02280 [Klebsiella pneumoniae]
MPGNDQINESFLRYREFQFMSKMMHDSLLLPYPLPGTAQFSDRGAGLALAATTLAGAAP